MRTIARALALFLLFWSVSGQAQDFQKGMEAYQQGDFETALEEWRPLAEQGHADAQVSLGAMYHYGYGVPQDDTEAAKWFRLAASAGNERAQQLLNLVGKEMSQDDLESMLRLARECIERQVKDCTNAQTSEVHAVAVYEGNVETNGTIHGPEVRVVVDRPDANVILVLGSYEAVRWIVEESSETNIGMIYVHGHQAERSEVLLNDVPFSNEMLGMRSTHRQEGERFRALVDTLSVEFDVPRIASFHGAYKAPDAPFVVDSVQDSTENEVDYLLPQVRPEALTDKLRDFLEGPTETIARLEEEGFFLQTDAGLIHYPITLDVPSVSWPGRATYDPVNQRLFAGTAWHVGYFYTYSILNDRWTAFEQPRGMKVHGAIYDVDQDRLILGVEGNSSAAMNSTRIMEMSPSGEMLEISHDVLLGLTDLEDVDNGPAAILVPLAVDGDLLLAKGLSRFSGSTISPANRMYVIDLETGQVTLVGLQN